MFSLAKSVVGRALNVFGMSKRRPFNTPVMILIIMKINTKSQFYFFKSFTTQQERISIVRGAMEAQSRQLLRKAEANEVRLIVNCQLSIVNYHGAQISWQTLSWKALASPALSTPLLMMAKQS